MKPSLGITVTETVREGTRLIMFGVPCPTCGHTGQTMTLREVTNMTGVSPATLSRFLSGKDISSSVLDRLYEWVQARLPDVSA